MTAIEWINQSESQKPAFLSSNSRSVNLFRIKDQKVIRTESVKRKVSRGNGLCIPKFEVKSVSKEAKLVTTFKTGKEHHLHSLALGADGENFISADSNRVNLWNLERDGADVYNLIDYNRHKFSDQDEIVTSAKFS